MFRLCLSLVVGLLLATPDGARAVEVRLGLTGSVHASSSAATSANVATEEIDTTVPALGTELRVRLPYGLRVGGHYAHHRRTVGGIYDSAFGAGDVEFDLDADEFGVFAEAHLRLAPWSWEDPFVGIGLGYVRLVTDGRLRFTSRITSTDPLDVSIDLARLYGVGGVDLTDRLGLILRAGYTFGDERTLGTAVLQRITGGPAAATWDHEGLYGSAGLVVVVH
ncbi:MAG TPA: hypothetical protein VKA86_03795 [Candidatus Krumholzibacteria bacterium]|nr:hypothetical protein [Candidatus Krumholzibacteria bacterium]